MKLDWLVDGKGNHPTKQDIIQSAADESSHISYYLTHFDGILSGKKNSIPMSYFKLVDKKVRLDVRVLKTDLVKSGDKYMKENFSLVISNPLRHHRASYRKSNYHVPPSDTTLYTCGLQIRSPLNSEFRSITHLPFHINEGEEIAKKLYSIIENIAPDYYNSRVST